jgi:undecaprenyl diphosphate synthase
MNRARTMPRDSLPIVSIGRRRSPASRRTSSRQAEAGARPLGPEALPAGSAAALPEGIRPDLVPRHVACVMDGNGRWAQQRGLKRTDGHAAGEEALWDTVMGALDLGIEWFSVYAFSTENWRRPVDEVRFLMNFNESLLVNRRDWLNDLGVRVRFIGRRNWRVPRRVLRNIEEAEALTARNRRMTLTFCFNYGGRAELVDAVQRIVADGISAEKISEQTIRDYLYAPDMPDPDVVIRTSGEYRISNFLLWELAYSELVFTPVLWPDFRRGDLFDAVREFQRRDRRFGGVEPGSIDDGDVDDGHRGVPEAQPSGVAGRQRR